VTLLKIICHILVIVSVLFLVNTNFAFSQQRSVDEDAIYQLVKKYLKHDRPGYGKSDYGTFDVVDIPKAYAMFLSSELMQYKTHCNDYDLSQAIKAGLWLLHHSDENHDGIVGWGVPVAWDAFGDNSLNEKNTEYTIATGIVINGLMDWIELAPHTAPKSSIISLIEQAIAPYLERKSISYSGLFNYSLKIEDRKYNCFNAAIYLAGQMQRFTFFISDKAVRDEIRLYSDQVMSAALRYKKIDPSGGWYWSYSIEENTVPNDMAHAGYIVEGICTYLRNKGTLSELFDEQAILSHLKFFSNEKGTEWYFYPSFFSEEKISPRLYGVGMILHIYAKYLNSHKETIQSLIQYSQKYRLKSGLYSRWQNENIIITEYLTYLLYGLSSTKYYDSGFNDVLHLLADDNHKIRYQKSIEKVGVSTTEYHIPFSTLEVDGLEAGFDARSLHTVLVKGDNKIILDKYKAVPVKILSDMSNVYLFLRELLSNHLILVKIKKSGHKFFYTDLDKNKNHTFSDFREAIIFQDHLVLIAYESIKARNVLLSLSLFDFHIENKIVLPSVEYPAGRTYEVIPKFIICKNKDKRLYLMSGRLFVEYDGLNIEGMTTPDDVKTYLEAILDSNNQLYVIYKTKSDLFKVSNLIKKINYYHSKLGEIIFDLDYYRDSPQFRKLYSLNDLEELFWYDFVSNKGNGVLYLGTNNIEGWSAWAQVYYLNGMMSFLELAENDIEFYETFSEVVPQMKKRLQLEMALLLYQLESSEGLRCRAFSVDRTLATFAVQSSRFAMIFQRYLALFHDNAIQHAFNIYSSKVVNLSGHMEVLKSGESKVVSKIWNPIDAFYLEWPKGNSFYFDGLPVPYNHQNEWATFVLKHDSSGTQKKAARSMIKLFLHHNATEHTFSSDAIWPYWWAKARDGWKEYENISLHKPSYIGDTGDGWISFRTIDAISVVTLYEESRDISPAPVLQIRNFISEGKLYPFASGSFIALNCIPRLSDKTVAGYMRFSTPWEFDNVVWSYFNFVKGHK